MKIRNDKEMKLLEHAAVGVEFAACVVIGMFMGSRLDRWLDTEPWMTFLFTIFGFAAGIRALLRAYRLIERARGDSHPEDESSHGDGSRSA